MIGRIKTAWSFARKGGELRRAIGEVQDVIAGLNAITQQYERASADGNISPEEAEVLLKQVAVVARNGMEARAVIARII